jgi:hypothetical protein
MSIGSKETRFQGFTKLRFINLYVSKKRKEKDGEPFYRSISKQAFMHAVRLYGMLKEKEESFPWNCRHDEY